MSYFRQNIEAMEGYTPGEQPTDPSVIKLNTNENPYPPSPKVMEAIARLSPEQLRRYPHPLGNAFRDQAAEIFGVRRDQIICGNGMDDILNMTVRAFSGPEAALVYPAPTYTLYAVLANIQASVVREIPWGPDYSLPHDELIKARGRVTYLANPNAPTGTLVPFEQVARLADSLDGVLCIDEAYVDFAERNCMELAKTRPNVLVMRTLSKGYSLAGLRFGFAVGDAGLISGLGKVKDSYNVDAVAIAAATAAIADQAYHQETRRKVIGERERLAPALAKIGLPCLPSQSNFLFARATRPPALDTRRGKAARLAEGEAASQGAARELYESLKARGILVRYFSSPGIADFLRITVGRPDQNDALVAALKELMA